MDVKFELKIVIDIVKVFLLFLEGDILKSDGVDDFFKLLIKNDNREVIIRVENVESCMLFM